jgi:uncharacterized protein (TIGR03067 family)
MRIRVLALLAVGLLIAADDKDQADAGKKDLKALEGTWKAVKGEENGAPVKEGAIKQFELTIKGDKYTLRVNGEETEQGTLKLDPTKKPKAVDFKITKGDDEGKDQHGLYQIEGDRFTLCFAPPGKDRPKQLKTEAGSEQTLIVFERLKS